MRAARAWLNWTMDDLVKESGLSRSAVFDFENDANENPRINTLEKLVRAFDRHDVRLLPGGIEQVEKGLFVLTDFLEVLADAEAVSRPGDVVYFHCADDRRSHPSVSEKLLELERKGLELRFTYERGNAHRATARRNYRWIDPDYFASSQVETVYADRYVVHVEEPGGRDRFQVVKNRANADARRRQIEYWWLRGEPLPDAPVP